MKPKIIVLRHSQSQEDIDKTVYDRMSDLEVPLTPLGCIQATRFVPKLITHCAGPVVRFYMSPARRLIQTYERITDVLPSNIRAERIIDELLLKQNWGKVTTQNRKSIEKERYKVGVLRYRFPGGESGFDLIERYRVFWNKLFLSLEYEDKQGEVVIITHGFEFRVLLLALCGWTEEYFETLAHPYNLEFKTLINDENGKYILQEVMRTHDLFGAPGFVSRVH